MEPDADARDFSDPLEVVDRMDLDYGTRLEILQEWRARLVKSDAEEEELKAVDGAIQALEMGARVQGDQSDEIPAGSGAKRAR
jgi:hypothetical protein